MILAAILFFVAMQLSRGKTLPKWEADMFSFFYGLPEQLYPFFYIVTQFGSVYVLGALLVFYLLRRHYHVVLRLLLTGTLAYLLAGIAKSIWGRARPEELLTDIITLDFTQGPGFPSGHVALAVALALTMGHYLKRKLHWVVFVWIILVAISRMYLGVHVPLDLVGGFAIGWFSYAIFRQVRIYDVVKKRHQT
jgi:membrane-associated phospholipid phosphatase